MAWIILAVVVVFFIVAGVFICRESVAIRRQTRCRIEEAFRSAKPRLYRQSNQGLTVLVRADNHEKTKGEYEAAIARGEKKPWEEIRFVVSPAFTFCDENHGRKMTRTGDGEGLRAIIMEATLRTTGLTREDFYRARYDFYTRFTLSELAKLIVPESPFLFVPFSSREIPYEEQAKLFTPKTFVEAREYLLRQ